MDFGSAGTQLLGEGSLVILVLRNADKGPNCYTATPEINCYTATLEYREAPKKRHMALEIGGGVGFTLEFKSPLLSDWAFSRRCDSRSF